MSYEKELEYLRKEFKKSEAKFREAEREGYETDSDIWQNDMVNIGHQIHIHEQATKADEYEAKAKAFDAIKKEVAEELKRLTVIQADFPLAFESKIETLKNVMASMTQYESGEYDAKK